MMIGEHGNLGLWPAGGSALQWWFDLPWSTNFVRPQRPIETIRSHFNGWSDMVDQVLATLTDDDLAPSPFPHFRHPIPRAGAGALTLLGDAAHTMPPTLAAGDESGPAGHDGVAQGAVRFPKRHRPQQQ